MTLLIIVAENNTVLDTIPAVSFMVQSIKKNRNKFEDYLKQLGELHPRTSQQLYICHARNFLPNEEWPTPNHRESILM